jgi:hypothetical protein
MGSHGWNTDKTRMRKRHSTGGNGENGEWPQKNTKNTKDGKFHGSDAGGQRAHSHFGGDFRNGAFAYVRLKSLMFAYFEKKYFFPALWPSSAGAQWVGALTVEGWKKNGMSPVASSAGATSTGRVRGLFLLDELAWAMYLEALEIELNKKFGMA